jgi:hypothetical protein
MRNPNHAVALVQGWRDTGCIVSKVLDELLVEGNPFEKVVTLLRGEKQLCNDTVNFWLKPLAQQARENIALALGKTSGATMGPTGWCVSLIAALTEHAGDPDVDIQDWLAGRTPLGITQPIPYRGVFPEAPDSEAKLESLQYFEVNKRKGTIVCTNYSSFQENEDAAKLELERLISGKHVVLIGTWEKVLEMSPEAIATKLALITKERPDHTLKVRFVVDMLRSGVNGLVKVYERIVLPRGVDLIESVLDLWEGVDSNQTDATVELLVADFVDAFLQLKILDEERPYVIVCDGKGSYFGYVKVPFGLGSAPLLWGRVAAWLTRSAQALLAT